MKAADMTCHPLEVGKPSEAIAQRSAIFISAPGSNVSV